MRTEVILMSALTLAVVIPVMADAGLPWIKGEKGGIRPSMPSRQIITSEYCDGVPKLSFVIDEGPCKLTVVDNESGMTFQYFVEVSSLETEVFIGNLKSADLSLETASGNNYYSRISR